METAKAVGDGKLSNEELGIIYRRIGEIAGRINGGSITHRFALEELQRIAEGGRPSPASLERSPPIFKFKRPDEWSRKHSKAPYGECLPNYKQRLNFPDRNREHVMAEMWEAENIPHQGVNSGRVPLNTILNTSELVERDVQVVASTLQWLATNVGSEFLSRFVQASKMRV